MAPTCELGDSSVNKSRMALYERNDARKDKTANEQKAAKHHRRRSRVDRRYDSLSYQTTFSGKLTYVAGRLLIRKLYKVRESDFKTLGTVHFSSRIRLCKDHAKHLPEVRHIAAFPGLKVVLLVKTPFTALVREVVFVRHHTDDLLVYSVGSSRAGAVRSRI